MTRIRVTKIGVPQPKKRQKVRKVTLRKTPVKKVNRERRKSEFARCFGSRERVRFINALPCLVCGRVPSDNHHTEYDGTWRKADYTTIVPLCRSHHMQWHHWGPRYLHKMDPMFSRIDFAQAAEETERRWQAFNNSLLEKTG